MVIKELSKYLPGVEVMVSTGGTQLKEDIYRLYNKVHVLVGTPGRILDLASRGIAKLGNIHTLVLDEVDKLLSVDFRPIVER
jgi:ATP-dependent RNA helicase DDX6/DHH1